MSNYVTIPALHTILKERDLQFLAVLDKRDREFHQVMDAKERQFSAELASRDATISKLQKEMTQLKAKVQIVQDQHAYNAAVSGLRLAFIEEIARSKPTQTPIQKDNPTEGEKISGELRGDGQEKVALNVEKKAEVVVSVEKETEVAEEVNVDIAEPVIRNVKDKGKSKASDDEMRTQVYVEHDSDDS